MPNSVRPQVVSSSDSETKDCYAVSCRNSHTAADCDKSVLLLVMWGGKFSIENFPVRKIFQKIFQKIFRNIFPENFPFLEIIT
jgi:hypothetical protein